MENLAPPLELAIHLRFSIEKGEALRTALHEYCHSHICTDQVWRQQLLQWTNAFETRNLQQFDRSAISSPHRQILLSTLAQGLRGEPIFESLILMEEELFVLTNQEVERWVSTLPLKSLLPLLCLEFPAFVILMIGPVLANYLTAS